MQYTFAEIREEKNIYESSIAWNDVASRNQLLQNTPQWPFDFINTMFYLYQHPETNHLPHTNITQQYNLQFINSLWGPLNNPFNNYQRPAKLFVFFKDTKSNDIKKYIISPLIKDSESNDYYVFDKEKSQPLGISQWINYLKINAGKNIEFYLNICNGYGNNPNDICNAKSYQQETAEIYRTNNTHNKPIARNPIPSAYRAINEDWSVKAKYHSGLKGIQENGSIYYKSITWDNIAPRNKLLQTVMMWPNYQLIEDNFKKIRDLRYFNDENKSHFLRRITWLYPDDGCWTRASAVIKDLFGPMNNIVNHFSRPSKIFVFGNLCANTSNAPNKRVTWWYHTAPIIRDAETNQSYVLDPSVNPNGPTKVEQWIAIITSRTEACSNSASYINTFNICNGYGSGPYDTCQSTKDDAIHNEVDPILDQSYYRYTERNRQIELGRDANLVLGEQPPWQKSTNK